MDTAVRISTRLVAKVFFFYFVIVISLFVYLPKKILEGISNWCEDALRKTNPKR